MYINGLKELPLTLPKLHLNSEDVFHLFVIRTQYRDELMNYLIEKEIIPGIHYPIPIHLQPAYLNRIRTSSNMEETVRFSREILSLPIYPELQETEVNKIISTLNNYFYEKVVK